MMNDLILITLMMVKSAARRTHDEDCVVFIALTMMMIANFSSWPLLSPSIYFVTRVNG